MYLFPLSPGSGSQGLYHRSQRCFPVLETAVATAVEYQPEQGTGASDELYEDLQESFPFLDEMAETEVAATDRNPNGAGRKGQDFISYLKAFLLAPVLPVEQNSEAVSQPWQGIQLSMWLVNSLIIPLPGP